MAGLTNYAMANEIGSVHVGLFTAEPDDDGTGGTEATGSGYARKAHAAWTNVASGGVRYRQNSSAVEFAALTGDLVGIVAWGIWDAATAGNLIAWGMLLDSGGNEITKTFTNGNQPRFPTGELKVGLQDEV